MALEQASKVALLGFFTFLLAACGPGLDTEKLSSSCSKTANTPFFTYSVSPSAGPNLGATGKLAQSFTLAKNRESSQIVASVLGTTGALSQAIIAHIQSDSLNNPSGNDLFTSSPVTLNINVATPDYFNFVLENVGASLQAGVQYWLVLESVGGGPSYTWNYFASGSGARIFSSSWSTLGTQTLVFSLYDVSCY